MSEALSLAQFRLSLAFFPLCRQFYPHHTIEKDLMISNRGQVTGAVPAAAGLVTGLAPSVGLPEELSFAH